MASFSTLFVCLFSLFILSHSSLDSFVYSGCSQIKYTPNSPYESNLNSLLTSLVNSATCAGYNKYSIVGTSPQDVVHGLYQCRGDLAMPDCATCVARAVSQFGDLCSQTCGGAIQLQGCFVKYDNSNFVGVEDKTVLMKKCGPYNGHDFDAMNRRDAVLASLSGAGGLFRVGGSQYMQGVAQCVGDLSMGQCQDCLSEAIEGLKAECGGAVYGHMFLSKCYARYSTNGADVDATQPDHRKQNSRIKFGKRYGITIGLSAGVSLTVAISVSIGVKIWREKRVTTIDARDPTFNARTNGSSKRPPIGGKKKVTSNGARDPTCNARTNGSSERPPTGGNTEEISCVCGCKERDLTYNMRTNENFERLQNGGCKEQEVWKIVDEFFS